MFDQFSSDFDKNSLEPNSLNFALNQVQLKLQTFFATSTASEQLNQVFDVTDQNASNFLIANGKNGIFDIPQLQILPDIAMNGAQAAFSLAKDTIYLADSLVGGSTLDIEKVIIEELGHKFDALLNPGMDTPGDEGELFKDIVLGLPLSQPELLRIQTENDFGTVVVDNQVISVEQAHKNSTDATGDGKGDAIVVNNDGVYVRRSNGSKFLPNEKWIDIPFWGSIGTGFSDVTGDGKADAIASNNDGVYVRRSDGSKFLPNEKWTDIGYSGTQGTWFADVTGDGKADAIVSNNDGVYIRRSDGSKFLPNEKWTEIGYLGSKGTWFADVTGDGKADAIVANNDGVYIRRSNGSKFLPNEKWTDIGYWGSQGTWFADATGDGKADAIASNNDGVYIRRSDGNKFLPNEKWTEIGYLGSKAAGFGDVTGDGKADAIVSNNDGVYVRRSNGSKFLPNEKWTDIGYWGSKGTWFGDVALTGTSSTPPPPVGKYQLPYPDGKTYQVTQGNNGGTSHYDQWNRYAWDFNMLEGSTVVATRGGKVVSLYEGSQTKLSSLNGWSQYTNYVLIDHGDGTSALYLHLKYNGVLPNVGDSVSQNQPIAQSGKTGYILGIPGDHLHYSVQKTPSNIPAGGFSNKSGNYVTESLPSSFSDPGVLSKNSNGVPTYPNNYTS
jgi:Membrane proteins related to metalloendopeptidases